MPLTRPGRSAFVAAACVVGAAACDARPPAPDARRDPRHDAALADTLVGTVVAAYDFSRPGVPERLAGLYPADGPVVSAAGGGVTTSRAALRAEIERFWARVGRNMREPRFVVGERHVTPLGPDAAALTFTYAIPHRTPEGRPHTLAGAWTAVFRRDAREDGRWVIVQEHLSDAPPAGAPGVAGDTARAAAGPGGAPHAGH